MLGIESPSPQSTAAGLVTYAKFSTFNNLIVSSYRRQQLLKSTDVHTCSSFIIRGRSCDLLAISSKVSSCPSAILVVTEFRPFTGLSDSVISPPAARLNASTPRQLLSVEAGNGAKSEAKESSGNMGEDPTAEVCRKGPAKSGEGLRITPARVLLGIHRAKRSAWE